MAKELCEAKLKGFEYVISTHIDKDHIHNHILVNSVNYENGKKLCRNKNKIKEFREYSHYLCLQNGLSIIDISNYKGKSVKYKEWIESKHGKSWKRTLKKEIDEVIRKTHNFETFLLILRRRGWVICDETKDGKDRKWISYHHPKMEKSVRDRSLGYQYFKENIVARIELNRLDIDTKDIIKDKKPSVIIRKLKSNFIPKTHLEVKISNIFYQIKKILREQEFKDKKNKAIKYYKDNVKKLESLLVYVHENKIQTEQHFEAKSSELQFNLLASK